MSFVYPGILQYGFPELDLTNKLDEKNLVWHLYSVLHPQHCHIMRKERSKIPWNDSKWQNHKDC